MNLEEAIELFNEIVELCYDSENPRLIETIESIYPEANKADDVNDIISLCDEIQVVINEEEFLDEEEDIVAEIQEKIELLSE
jgi:hypothetical protein